MNLHAQIKRTNLAGVFGAFVLAGLILCLPQIIRISLSLLFCSWWAIITFLWIQIWTNLNPMKDWLLELDSQEIPNLTRCLIKSGYFLICWPIWIPKNIWLAIITMSVLFYYASKHFTP